MRLRLYMTVIAFALLSITAAETSASVRRDTPDFWKCQHRIGGIWEFGQAPAACDGASFGDDRKVFSQYGALIFNDTRVPEAETPRYMEEMHAVLRDGAAHYLRRRKPRASPVEVTVFRRAVLALAHQESYWTHYRKASDGRLKMMRGDLGHGHGLMQIDDRFHFVKIQNGDAWDLIGNLTYALELFYAEWENAVGAPCLKRATDFESRARSAYSGYNGGPSQICRWTDRTHKWARNDQGYLGKFRALEWFGYIANPDRKAAFDVGCAIDGGGCLVDGGDSSSPFRAVRGGRFVGVCFEGRGGTECVAEERDVACLTTFGLSTSDLALQPGEYDPGAGFRVHDRHELCAQAPVSAIGVGKTVRVKTSLFLRATPGGGRRGIVKAGSVAEVLDFEVKIDEDLARYYKIRTQEGGIGWVFGGGFATSESYLEQTEGAALRGSFVPTGTIEAVLGSGINIRATPGGAKIGVLPPGGSARVRSSVVRSMNGEVYLEIEASGHRPSGYIYAGRLSPSPTVSLWVKAVAP